MNSAVAECDLGEGKGIQLYCRHCIEDFMDWDSENVEIDETLIFCNREWEAQGN